MRSDSVDPRAPLADGSAIVFGVVEGEAGEGGPAVVITIHQRGTEEHVEGTTTQHWKETHRESNARPFYVRRDDGSRVRVEPDERVVVHDALLGVVRGSVKDQRSRVAEVRPGEQVHVSGELAGAGRSTGDLRASDRKLTAARGGVYRTVAVEPVLRPPRFAPMVISSEPPGDTEKKRMRFHAWCAVGLAAVLAFAGAVVVRDYLFLVLDGQRVRVTPTAFRTWTEWVQPKGTSGHRVTYYAVRAQALAPGGVVTLEDQCTSELYERVRAGEQVEVSFVVATHHPSVFQLGEGPAISEGQVMGLSMLLLALGGIYPLAARMTRPWYARRKVNDTVSGPLPTLE